MNVFAKAQGIVKAKHRFLVQHAGYSLRQGMNPHFIALQTTVFQGKARCYRAPFIVSGYYTD
ncbi:hypothetical protein DA103_12090 [Enterobacter cloacae]|uniref:Uncharacterized protein n=1 Tax=Enterobacter cloacae TaxID=550 RepID=A0A2T4Y0E2_ENTCL|nr:hypothetical protein DA103_12090 [Enterobacter cloacae]RWS56060.1 hypothetical protein DN586_10850 [Enterobacter cloacae]RXW26634.1 hypothetical protein DM877_23490 [Enterobacter cloacae]